MNAGIKSALNMGQFDIQPAGVMLNGDGKIDWREYDPAARSAYTRVLGIPGKTEVDAIEAAQWANLASVLNKAVELFPLAASEYQGSLSEVRRTVTAALIAKEVYFDGIGVPEMLPANVHRVSSESELRTYGLTQALLDANDTIGYYGALYVGDAWDHSTNSRTTEIYYANRGTEPGGRGRLDWINNLLQGIGRGQEAPQYTRAIAIALRLKPGSARLTFVGHSLGGGLASAQSLVAHREGITFNAAGIRPETTGGIDLTESAKLITAVGIKNEILGWVQGPGGPLLRTASAGAANLAELGLPDLLDAPADLLEQYVASKIEELPEAVGTRVELDARLAWNPYHKSGYGNPTPGGFVRTTKYGPLIGEMTNADMLGSILLSRGAEMNSLTHNMYEMHGMNTVLYSLYGSLGLDSLSKNIATEWRRNQ